MPESDSPRTIVREEQCLKCRGTGRAGSISSFFEYVAIIVIAGVYVAVAQFAGFPGLLTAVVTIGAALWMGFKLFTSPGFKCDACAGRGKVELTQRGG